MRVLTALLLCVTSLANAQTRTLPTDADLKTAYCIRVIKTHAERMSAAAPAGNEAQQEFVKNMIAERNSELIRLQSYLLPKLDSLEASGLIAAAGRADADLPAADRAKDQCAQRCVSSLENGSPGSKWAACMNSCSAEFPAYVRVSSCRNINWLPF